MVDAQHVLDGFPRTRGDEPVAEFGDLTVWEFSPHTRG